MRFSFIATEKACYPVAFDKIYDVSIGENGTFIVREWVEEEITPPTMIAFKASPGFATS